LYLAADSRLANDPLLLPDMRKAVARLQTALAAGEVIGVFGDFDTDGIAGTALLVQALRELGAVVVPYLPNRVDEGHGLNPDAIKSLRSQGVTLLVTVDCGTSSAQEVALASAIGIDTIITDHHSTPTSLPDASALVNPNLAGSAFPYNGLTGSGISFKLAEALWADLGRPRPDHMMDLAALGTIADVGPLTGENRFIVKMGLARLNQTPRPGIRALIDRSGLTHGSLNTESLSFGLIPRLNAAGRLGDALTSLELLIATTVTEAEPIAEGLDRQNRERRQLTEAGVAEAQRQVEVGSDATPPIIMVEHSEWLPGIVGLIAGRLADLYYRPAVAIVVGEQVSRASARSIPEFNIVEALHFSRGLFHRYGGHPRAAGFTLSTADLPRLKGELMAVADEKLRGVDLVPSIEIDCEVSPALFDDANFGFVQSLQPFGEGNRAPVFLTRNVQVAEVRRVGQSGGHLKMKVSHGGNTWDAIAFRQGHRAVFPGDKLDLLYSVELNDWGGQPTLQLNVLDFRPGR
jgi:single-stranded-DNA-specific exonuclease